MKLILFDIDGTLIDSGEAGSRSLNLAFEEVFSIPHAFKDISMAGKTDIQIMKEALRRHGINHKNGNIEILCESYIRHLRIQIENPFRHLKPFIKETLSILSSEQDNCLGLLTGNIKEGAMIKLSPFGIAEYFSLTPENQFICGRPLLGAFGDDDEDRNRLLPVALERFRKVYKRDIDIKDCIVIGDTPRDVECAKVHGAMSIAVATGPYTYESLLLTEADIVLRDLSEMLLNPHSLLNI